MPGSDGGGARWATISSLIETAKLNGVEPYAYLRDVLQKMIDGHPVNRLDELLPLGPESRIACQHPAMCSPATLTAMEQGNFAAD